MTEELQTRKRLIDKRLIAPIVAIVVLVILANILRDIDVPVPLKIVIQLLPVFGVAWWARVKSKIENVRDELDRRIFLETSALAFIIENLVLISYSQLQSDKVVQGLDLTFFTEYLIGLWLIIYILVRRKYVTHAESN